MDIGGGGEERAERLCIEDYLLPRKMPARGGGRTLEYYAFRCPSPPLSSWELRMVRFCCDNAAWPPPFSPSYHCVPENSGLLGLVVTVLPPPSPGHCPPGS